MRKTVKVRVAVAIDPTGRWAAFGQAKLLDKAALNEAGESFTAGAAHYWLTAELPVPEADEVVATVERG